MIRLENVSHTFSTAANDVLAVRDVSLDLPRGSFMSVVGPSGCGKSTLLSLISGLLPVQTGSVTVDGEPVDGVRRDATMMLQSDALLPWRTVRQNVGLALEIRGEKKGRAERVDAIIERVGLAEFADARPSQLSGGMRKRVQLAASLVYNPSIILMDEPFGALDAFTRANMQQLLVDLCRAQGATCLFVTHDLDEAVALSDRVAIFSKRPGTVKAVHDIALPRDRDVADVQGVPGFTEARQELWDELRDEIDRELPAGDSAEKHHAH
ncbi:ABC transporter ATP-binding protein [Aeromicrobium sp. YIM 150415]|uniref:ABC transporter ATP-binding protein n=1 Tax=Aeromicrobium sp. YIM 150415 TaxID=2803912 RepID=UPI0019669EF1|nr:ABC transporter ATP-binding protein [Aeromicrobium sp. YIM 150415]MBM9463716.1 ABC transporter ATP-binding protein [Aeromicrobium sp. YIM 150415]